MIRLLLPFVLPLCVIVRAAGDEGPQQAAATIYSLSSLQGGLVVHVGSTDGELTAALGQSDRYVVQGLARSSNGVKQARSFVKSQGCYGRVSVTLWTGPLLPYSDNLVNLLVVEPAQLVADTELMRVLSPGGTLVMHHHDGTWEVRRKPWSDAIDQWTHYLHGPDNNAVARDTQAGSPHHMQWVAGPRWARGHEVLATISAVVTARGRLFYIADEGPTASVDLPSNWILTARDAFSGVRLWQSKIESWESQHRPFRTGPTDLPRRLVAVGDQVFVTLGYQAPVSALDAATGTVLREYVGTEGTEEILVQGEKLFLVVGDLEAQRLADQAVRRGQAPAPVGRRVMAVDAVDGKILWERDDESVRDLFGQTLALNDKYLFFQNTRAVVCLDRNTGSTQWSCSRPAALKRPAWSVPTLVVHGDIVFSADRNKPDAENDPGKALETVELNISFKGGQSPAGELIALDAETGVKLWSCPCREGYNSPVDVLIADGLLWTGEIVKAGDPGITEARDPRTGEVKRTRPRDQKFFSPGMSHHRCYRNRATSKFLVMGRSGVELIRLEDGHAEPNHWIRGACQYGVLPANGMIYVPPHTCACYLKTKLNGLNALAPPAANEPAPQERLVARTDKLVRSQQAAPKKTHSEDWPMYRHDASRSGGSSTEIGEPLTLAWQTDLSSRLTGPVVAGGNVFVAQPEQHAVVALDATSGKTQWSFTTGGRIDSPPTWYQGLLLFGSGDGHVYCLRATDGQQLWKFRTGPYDRRVVIEDRVESAWPVSGSVLIHDGLAYFVAGRSIYLDGGLHLFALDPFTADVVQHRALSGRDPETREQPRSAVKGFDMEGGLPDLLSADGDSIYMRQLRFDAKLQLQPEGGVHLFSPTGFLDQSWWHRSYWLFGSDFAAGWGGWHRAGNRVPAGRLLVFNDQTIFGFGRNRYPGGNAGQWKTGEYYRLFAARKDPKEVQVPDRKGNLKTTTAVHFNWETRVDLEAHALVLAGKRLVIAGPVGRSHQELDAFRGALGSQLQLLDIEHGTLLQSEPIPHLPVKDGLVAAHGRVYFTDAQGTVWCYE